MFWKKQQKDAAPGKATAEKLPGPKNITEFVGKYLSEKYEVESNRLWRLKALVRPSTRGGKTYDVRIFDETEAASDRIKVRDYTSLDQYPELVLYEGWLDEEAKEVTLEAKRKAVKVQIYNEKEIKSKIESLTEPASNVLFYLAGSPASGGPLGRGAAIAELNPNYPKPKEKKYILYITNIEGTEPVGKRQKFLEDDKPKHLVNWIKERHFKAES